MKVCKTVFVAAAAMAMVMAWARPAVHAPAEFRPGRGRAEAEQLFRVAKSDILRDLRAMLMAGKYVQALRESERYAHVQDNELQNLIMLSRLRRDELLAQEADPYGDLRTTALEDIRREVAVRRAMWSSPTVLVLGADRDGEEPGHMGGSAGGGGGAGNPGSPGSPGSKDGLARYICRILGRHGLKDSVVRIVDESEAVADRWRELGSCRCAEAQEEARREKERPAASTRTRSR